MFMGLPAALIDWELLGLTPTRFVMAIRPSRHVAGSAYQNGDLPVLRPPPRGSMKISILRALYGRRKDGANCRAKAKTFLLEGSI